MNSQFRYTFVLLAVAVSLHPQIGATQTVGEPETLTPPPVFATANGTGERWSTEKARAWYDSQPWPIGCNYIPSTAINQIETWQAETFDPETMDRELALAESIGFNTVRIFSHDLVWEADPDGFKQRVKTFLDICEEHHIRVIFNFFTNGCYGFEGEARLGKQPDPVPGVHNSGWVQTPGVTCVNDRRPGGVWKSTSKTCSRPFVTTIAFCCGTSTTNQPIRKWGARACLCCVGHSNGDARSIPRNR